MFNNKNNKIQKQSNAIMERNRISTNSVFKGVISSDGDFRVDGVVEGELITTGKVIIGPSGKITGTLKCLEADIEGFFEGILEVKHELNLKTSAKVIGEVVMESLIVSPGAVFNANCKMAIPIKELKPKQDGAATQKEFNISKIS